MKAPIAQSVRGSDACPSCGAPAVGGVGGCRAVFDNLAVREFSDPLYFKFHRLCVDAYSLQHPEQFMKSTKSAATHLTAMCWSLERGTTLHLPDALKCWVDGARTFERIQSPDPGRRGHLTVLHAVAATTPQDYEIRVNAWARSAWEAWAMHWDQARRWIGQALGEQRHRR